MTDTAQRLQTPVGTKKDSGQAGEGRRSDRAFVHGICDQHFVRVPATLDRSAYLALLGEGERARARRRPETPAHTPADAPRRAGGGRPGPSAAS